MTDAVKRIIVGFLHANGYGVDESDYDTVALRVYNKVVDSEDLSMDDEGFETVLTEYKDEILNPHKALKDFLDQ